MIKLDEKIKKQFKNVSEDLEIASRVFHKLSEKELVSEQELDSAINMFNVLISQLERK